ncbi:hypothetical protein BRC92_04980 [Halobacteriales archaeon QS_4_69_31]|jgi:hypothetical protein|nr:MAG: hypothetical protein BRC92_04980 [Halobacteriales archaeon QS_4_69_31]
MTEESGTPDRREGDSENTHVGAGGPQPLIDSVFEVLADWRRREVCQFFVEADAETATVAELAVLVAGCRPTAAPAGRSHGDLVDALAETHLPCLDRAGVVDYDPRSSTVRYRGQPTVEKWLEHVTAVDDRG